MAWVLVGSVFVLAFVPLGTLAVTAVVQRNRLRREKLADNRAWADLIDQADDDNEAVLRIGDVRHWGERLIDEKVNVAMARYQEARRAVAADATERMCQERETNEVARRQATNSRLSELRQREGTFTYEALEGYLDSLETYQQYLSQEDQAYVSKLLARLTKAYADKLCDKVRLGDTDSMETLADLVFPDPDASSEVSRFQRQTGEAYAFPDDWQELIVRLVKKPALDTFIECEQQLVHA